MILTAPTFGFRPNMSRPSRPTRWPSNRWRRKSRVLAQREVEAHQRVGTAKGDAEELLVVVQAQAKANEVLAHALTPILVSDTSIARWNESLPQVAGGAVPFIAGGNMPGVLG